MAFKEPPEFAAPVPCADAKATALPLSPPVTLAKSALCKMKGAPSEGMLMGLGAVENNQRFPANCRDGLLLDRTSISEMMTEPPGTLQAFGNTRTEGLALFHALNGVYVVVFAGRVIEATDVPAKSHALALPDWSRHIFTVPTALRLFEVGYSGPPDRFGAALAEVANKKAAPRAARRALCIFDPFRR